MYYRLIFLIIFVSLIIYIAIIPNSKILNKNKTIKLEIKGEVLKEKIIEVPLGTTFAEIIDDIGLTSNSNLENISLQQILYNNQIIVIPKKNNINKISINSANLYELSVLPGIGKSIALKIINYRNEYGCFTKLEDLMNISGIGNKKYEKIKDFISL